MKILGYNYTVYCDGIHEDIGAYGRCHHGRQRIQIATNLAEEQVASTILHEILHVLNYHLGLDLKENTIMALESGLYLVLTENGINIDHLITGLIEEPPSSIG